MGDGRWERFALVGKSDGDACDRDRGEPDRIWQGEGRLGFGMTQTKDFS